MNITDILYAKKLSSGGGGGGGDSDFSTAKVTFTNTSQTDNCLVYIPNYYYDEEYDEGGTMYSTIVYPESSVIVDMLLYKGTGNFEIPFGTLNSTTGNIEAFSGYGYVTGDGTVNVTGITPISLYYIGELTITTDQPIDIVGGIFAQTTGSNTTSLTVSDTKTVKLFGVSNSVIIYPIYRTLIGIIPPEKYVVSGNAELNSHGVKITGNASITFTLT